MDLQPSSSTKRTYSDAFSEEDLPIDPTLPLAEKLKEFASRHFESLPFLWSRLETSKLPEKLEIFERPLFIQCFSELTEITANEEKNSLLELIGLDLEALTYSKPLHYP